MTPFSLSVGGRRALAVAVVAVVAVVVAYRHSSAASAPPRLQVAPVVPRPVVPATGRPLVVDVVGAVRRPGLVHLAPGSRVADAVAAAGGLGRKAGRSGVNFAAPVADGQQVVVPPRGAAAAAAAAGGSATAGPISLSSATADQLDTLPGIGPVTAQKILAYRQQHGAFRSVDELDAIPGIGTARLAELQGLVVP